MGTATSVLLSIALIVAILGFFGIGTIRLIERDDETFLAWARQPYACVIFNLHVVHTAEAWPAPPPTSVA